MREPINAACEGLVDRSVLERLLASHQLDLGTVYEMGGKQRLDNKLAGYRSAARFSPWIVLRDLDDDAACAPELASKLAPDQQTGLCLIVAVRQMEAWLLADRPGIAGHLKVAQRRIPEQPELLPDSKLTMINLARHSRSRDIRSDMLPLPGSGRKVGTGYTANVQGFVQSLWDFRRAAAAAPSLGTFVDRLKRYHQTGHWRMQESL
jgi:hypothetical protein